MAVIPHLALPFAFSPGPGRPAVVVEQDSLADVAACVEVIVRYRRGQLIENPGLGIEDPAFLADLPDEQILAIIAEQEPRAEVAAEEDWDHAAFLARLRLEVAYEAPD